MKKNLKKRMGVIAKVENNYFSTTNYVKPITPSVNMSLNSRDFSIKGLAATTGLAFASYGCAQYILGRECGRSFKSALLFGGIVAAIELKDQLLNRKHQKTVPLPDNINDSPEQDEEEFLPQEQTVDQIRNESTLSNYDDGQLVGKYVYKGDKAIIFSHFGSGKTVMTMGMAVDIANGRISKIVPEDNGIHSPQTVFYYDGENDPEDYVKIYGSHAVDTDNLHIIRKFYFRDVKAWLKDVREKLKYVHGDVTVVLDNISCIVSSFNANIIRELFLRDFTKIQRDFAPHKVTFIVVAHTNKEKELMGSNNQNNFATTVLKLSKRDDDYLQLEIIKNRKYGDMQGKSFLLAKRETDDGFKYDEYVRELESSEVSHDPNDNQESEKPSTCKKADRIPDEVKQEMKDWYQKGVDGHGLGAIAKKYPEYDLKPMEVKRILESMGVEF